MIPSYRLREETEKRQKAEEASKTIAAQFGDMETKYKTLQEAHEKATSTHGQDIALLGAGITDPEIRDFVRSRFQPTEDGGTFAEWLTAQREAPSPLLSPFLGTKTTTEETKQETAPATKQETPKGNPNGGAGQPAAHNGKSWGTEDITTARRKAGGVGLGTAKKAIMDQLRAEGLIR